MHAHVKPGVLTLPELAEALKRGGISRCVVFLSLDARVERLPGLFVRFAHPPIDPKEGRRRYDDETVKAFAKALEAGDVLGFGELSLRHKAGKEVKGSAIPADGPVVLQILDLAAKHGVPVNVHVESEYADELARALAHNRKAKVIWAHLGDAQADLVEKMIKAHENLHADVSCRHRLWKRGFDHDEQSLTTEDGKLKPAWKRLFETHPDRFLFATDIGGGRDREDDVEQLVALARGWLGELPSEAADAIAHGNAERLLGLAKRK